MPFAVSSARNCPEISCQLTTTYNPSDAARSTNGFVILPETDATTVEQWLLDDRQGHPNLPCTNNRSPEW